MTWWRARSRGVKLLLLGTLAFALLCICVGAATAMNGGGSRTPTAIGAAVLAVTEAPQASKAAMAAATSAPAIAPVPSYSVTA
jgi:hypothetical protein